MTRDRQAYMRARYLAMPPGKNATVTAAWRAAHPEQNRVNYQGQHCKRLYGITLEEKNALLKSQGGRCALCRTREPRGKGWHVDHDHKTKIIRGILCHHCNLGLGQLKDDIKLLHKAIAYLTPPAV